MSQTKRIPELDGIRGIAILLVLFYHFFWWGTNPANWNLYQTLVWKFAQVGWVGVNLFFVLSGYLITNILLEQQHRPDYYQRFYWRRALRILPAYYFTLIVLLFVYPHSKDYIFLSALFLNNFSAFLGVSVCYPVLYSLAIEEHFYLFWPTFVRWFQKKRFVIACIVIVVTEPILRGVGYALGWSEDKQPWCRFDSLVWGALLCCFVKSRWANQNTKLWLASTLLCISTLLFTFGAPYGLTNRNNLWGAALLYTEIDLFMAGLTLLALSSHRRLAAVFRFQSLRKWGWISYSAYLLHCFVPGLFRPLFELSIDRWFAEKSFAYICTRTTILLFLTYCVSSLSYQYLELPFLKAKEKLPAFHPLAAQLRYQYIKTQIIFQQRYYVERKFARRIAALFSRGY